MSNGNGTDAETEAFKTITMKKNRRYLQLYKERNFDGIGAMYSKDCRFMPSGFPIQLGPGGVSSFWKMAVEYGFYSLWFETVEQVGPIGCHAIERCRYVFHDKNGDEMQVGKYIVIWVKEDGDWKYHWDIWNPDSLPPEELAKLPIEV